MKRRSSSTGGVSTGISPISEICFCISGKATTALISERSLSTISFGVLAGATIICQEIASKPGSPASASGGTSGTAAARVSDVTPSARTLPCRMSGGEMAGSVKVRWTCPATTSVKAGMLPL